MRYIRSIKFDEESSILTIYFGKNGQGITSEFLEINNVLDTYTDKFTIYLMEDSFIDTLDDVYEFKFKLIPKDK